MTTTHRASKDTPEERRAHLYAATEKTGWVTPTCTHGTTAWEGEMPHCGERPCLWRWWLRWGIPSLGLLLAFIIYCCIHYHVPDCPPGWRSLGLQTCVRD